MYLILSDIHGNLSSLRSVLNDATSKYKINSIILLGDLIDYGMRSNEVVDFISKIEIPIISNIWGNHENAIMNNNYSNFSAERGVKSAIRTSNILTSATKNYINTQMNNSGFEEILLGNCKALVIHGSIENPFWKPISAEHQSIEYQKYDYVFSGHSHKPHCFEVFYECDNPLTRNKKKTIFINPGSVGQPRNLNPNAQYTVLDETGCIFMNCINYDIEYEQSLFNNEVDSYYRDRLTNGI